MARSIQREESLTSSLPLEEEKLPPTNSILSPRPAVKPAEPRPEIVITVENPFFRPSNVIVASAPPAKYLDADGNIVIS